MSTDTTAAEIDVTVYDDHIEFTKTVMRRAAEQALTTAGQPAKIVVSIREREGASDAILAVFDDPDRAMLWMVSARDRGLVRNGTERVMSIAHYNPENGVVPDWAVKRYGTDQPDPDPARAEGEGA